MYIRISFLLESHSFSPFRGTCTLYQFLYRKKKTCFHEQFLAPFLKRHHYNSYGSQELVAAPTHAELKVCPPLPPPHQKQRTTTTCVIFILGSPWTPTDKHQKCFLFHFDLLVLYNRYSTFWSNCRTSPSRLSTESGNTPIAMVSAVNFRTTFSSFGFISSDIDIEDNRYSLHYYLCVMQDVKCVIHLWEFSCLKEKRSKK